MVDSICDHPEIAPELGPSILNHKETAQEYVDKYHDQAQDIRNWYTGIVDRLRASGMNNIQGSHLHKMWMDSIMLGATLHTTKFCLEGGHDEHFSPQHRMKSAETTLEYLEQYKRSLEADM